jgi:[ribosomal protein S5]-alanine N-acetyltransferase
MLVALVQLSVHETQELAEARIPEDLALRAEEGALPPSFVCVSSLDKVTAGKAQTWCNTFLIVREVDGRIVGSCSYKDEPQNGRVEIGYGIAPSSRGVGAATAAVNALLELAFCRGAHEVLAEVEPENVSSSRVVQKAGFYKIGERVNESREFVIQWLARDA